MSRLRSDQAEDLILGDEYDRPWLAALPKTDLHFHIGTSISHPTIEALALNTAGYFFQGIALDPMWQAGRNGAADPDADPASQTAQGAADLVKNVCRIVVIANVLVNWPDIPKNEQLGPPEALWTAARYVLLPPKAPNQVVDPTLPTTDIFDQVVDWLTPKDKPNAKFETCGLLVAAVAVFERLVAEIRKPALRATVEDLVLRLAARRPLDADAVTRVVEPTTPPLVALFGARWQYLRRQAEAYPVRSGAPGPPPPRSSCAGRSAVSSG